MKINLDKEFLQKISNGEQELLISDEQAEIMERIEGMLKENIRFCSLVTGYRGTGKSSFIHYMLDKVMNENKKVVEISFNAAQYKNFKTFTRRFIRELYLQISKEKKAPEKLRQMYLQTFFDVKKIYKKEIFSSNKDENIAENKYELNGKIDIVAWICIAIRCLVILIAIVILFLFWNQAIVRYLTIFVGVILESISPVFEVKFKAQWLASNSHKITDETNRDRAVYAENIYDNEIAEYYIFDQLNALSNNEDDPLNLVFVIDELDKVDEKELGKIFHDLKPLLLSCDCNFILIAGRNMDRYLNGAKREVDGITNSVFTNKIYIPLGTIEEMTKLAVAFCKGNRSEDKWKYYSDYESIQHYFNKKILEAKGVKRAFINEILADLRWDNEATPYIEVDDSTTGERSITSGNDPMFNVLNKMEEYICKDSSGPERDELLKSTYLWIERINETHHKEFREEDITGGDEILNEYVVHSKVVKHINLANAFLRYMVEEELLIEINGTFKWKSDIAINDNSKKDISDEVTERDIEFVEYFQEQWEEIRNIIFNFACYNELIEEGDKDDEFIYEKYDDILKTMIGNSNFCYTISSGLKDLEMLYQIGIGVDHIDKIKENMDGMVGNKARLVEELISYTLKLKSLAQLYYSQKIFDVVLQDEEDGFLTFIDVKYYKNYSNAIGQQTIYTLLGKADKYMRQYANNDYVIKLIIFTNNISLSDIETINKKEQRILNHIENDPISVLIVPINDYWLFKRQLDLVMSRD